MKYPTSPKEACLYCWVHRNHVFCHPDIILDVECTLSASYTLTGESTEFILIYLIL